MLREPKSAREFGFGKDPDPHVSPVSSVPRKVPSEHPEVKGSRTGQREEEGRSGVRVRPQD